MEKDNEYKLLSRRLQLETKGLKTQLAAENHKQKELTQKLENSNSEILRLRTAIEVSKNMIYLFQRFETIKL